MMSRTAGAVDRGHGPLRGGLRKPVRCLYSGRGDKNELIAIREGEIPQPGEKVYIHVETEKLHLFDRGTEKSLGYPEMVIRAQEKLAVPKLEKAIAQ